MRKTGVLQKSDHAKHEHGETIQYNKIFLENETIAIRLNNYIPCKKSSNQAYDPTSTGNYYYSQTPSDALAAAAAAAATATSAVCRLWHASAGNALQPDGNEHGAGAFHVTVRGEYLG